MEMQGTQYPLPCKGLAGGEAGHPYLITHTIITYTNADHSMLHHNSNPTLFTDPPHPHPHPHPHLQAPSETCPTPLRDKACHQMAPTGANSRSHQELVTSPVTNNGPLTRKIRFVTALSSILRALSPIMQSVTKQRIDDPFGRGWRYSSPHVWWFHQT